MNQQATVRNRIRSPRRNDKPFLFLASEELLNQLRETAYRNDLSLSAFIRESIRRNIKNYERIT